MYSKLTEIKTCSYTTLSFYRRMNNVYGNYMTSIFVTLKPHQSVFAKFIHFIFLNYQLSVGYNTDLSME